MGMIWFDFAPIKRAKISGSCGYCNGVLLRIIGAFRFPKCPHYACFTLVSGWFYSTTATAVLTIPFSTRSIAIVWQHTPRLAKNVQSQLQLSS